METFFKVRIFDRHVKEKMDSEGYIVYEFEEHWEYKRFWYSFDLSVVRIVEYKDVVLFDELWNPIRATRVTLSNDYFFYAACTFETFESTVFKDYNVMVQNIISKST